MMNRFEWMMNKNSLLSAVCHVLGRGQLNATGREDSPLTERAAEIIRKLNARISDGVNAAQTEKGSKSWRPRSPARHNTIGDLQPI